MDLEDYFRGKIGYQSYWAMVVRMYVKMTKLVDVYTTAGVIKDQCTMRDFFRGFNEVHPLGEAIDAGDDREVVLILSADNITLFAQNEQCKHILLAGSADNGYIGFLRPFALSGVKERRLSLIETIPFPAAFQSVANQFTVVKLPQIFRNTKIKVSTLTWTYRNAIPGS
ncbi:hypothetical protein LTR12_016237 [Friedmanniomyces endolithicus]|nr:hypothetical protein LTR12_016237 [Friedmanniomyces endolithicus]